MEDSYSSSVIAATSTLPGLDIAQAKLGIWGRVQPPDTPLRERDRVEIYRPLRVDPKEARRQRYRRKGKSGSQADDGRAARRDG